MLVILFRIVKRKYFCVSIYIRRSSVDEVGVHDFVSFFYFDSVTCLDFRDNNWFRIEEPNEIMKIHSFFSITLDSPSILHRLHSNVKTHSRSIPQIFWCFMLFLKFLSVCIIVCLHDSAQGVQRKCPQQHCSLYWNNEPIKIWKHMNQ